MGIYGRQCHGGMQGQMKPHILSGAFVPHHFVRPIKAVATCRCDMYGGRVCTSPTHLSRKGSKLLLLLLDRGVPLLQAGFQLQGGEATERNRHSMNRYALIISKQSMRNHNEEQRAVSIQKMCCKVSGPDSLSTYCAFSMAIVEQLLLCTSRRAVTSFTRRLRNTSDSPNDCRSPYKALLPSSTSS